MTKAKESLLQMKNRIQICKYNALASPFAKTVFWPLLNWPQMQEEKKKIQDLRNEN